ncbi:MAG: DNA mismatch repair endonuclease MutL, partial [Candidatus Zixiibacteriota bacterium]
EFPAGVKRRFELMTVVKATNKRLIRPLPKNVINKIAAGEVVERPAAVVKELIENAVDAAATKIDLVIEKSGAKLIKIVDNGCGIDEDQIEIAFSRHATSKISNFSDLDSLTSFGFRGEALPSIASVSRLRMISRSRESDSGTEIIYEGGVLQSKKPIAAPFGTTIEVADLFFNTPARRKFLKSETTESRYLSRTATALAISNYRIGFTGDINDKRIFSFLPGQSLEERVRAVFGEKNKFVPVKGEFGLVYLDGCIGAPDNVRNNRYGQYLFINGRFVASVSLSHAWVSGYGELIPRGLFPVGALLLTINPADVDVNVHPSKTEVRLAREREVYDAVRKIISESLRQDGIIPELKQPEFQAVSESNSNFKPETASSRQTYSIPGVAPSRNINPGMIAELYKSAASIPSGGNSNRLEQVTIDKSTGEVFEKHNEPGPSEGFRFIGRFDNLYLLIEAGQALYIVDQHTAHERVLFEQMLEKVEKQTINAQNLLFPVQIELDPEQYAVFEESLELLNNSGFGVSAFGGRMVNVEAMPSIMSKKSTENTFVKVIDDLASLRSAGFDLKKAMAQSIACRAAVMAGDYLSEKEAIGLLEQLLKCQNKYSCPHGRPTFMRLSRADLDKQFGR